MSTKQKNNKTKFNVMDQWIYYPEKNESLLSQKINLKYRGQFFSATNFNFSITDFIISVLLLYGLYFIFAFGQTIFVLFPSLPKSQAFNFHWNWFRVVAQIFFPIFAGIILVWYLIWKYRSIFWQSGIFAIFLYVVPLRALSALSSFVPSFRIFYQPISNWFYLFLLLLIFVLALILMTDMQRSFLSIFFKIDDVNFYLAAKAKLFWNNPEQLNEAEHRKRLNFVGNILITFLLFCFVIFLMSYASSIAGSFISRILPRIPNSNEGAINRALSSSDFWITRLPTFLLVLIAAPLTEELVFRVGFSSFGNNKIISVIFSGVIFGLIHTQNDGLLNIFSYLLFGLTLAFAYSLTGNYWMVVVVHFTNNLLSVIF